MNEGTSAGNDDSNDEADSPPQHEPPVWHLAPVQTPDPDSSHPCAVTSGWAGARLSGSAQCGGAVVWLSDGCCERRGL